MSIRQYATFPGVERVVSCSYTRTHGISPNVAVLTCAPQANFSAEGGTLRFLFGDAWLDIPDCKVDYFSLQRNAMGEVWQFQIFDRRWIWKFGVIEGQYNHRDPDGQIKFESDADKSWEKTPQELAEILLDDMGETEYDVSALDNDARPLINWDVIAPAEALARLCDELGCRVVLTFANTVKIHKIGEGEDLPINELVLTNSLTINPPERPKTLTVAYGPTRYQADFLLEAVGINNDKDADGKLIGTLVTVGNLGYKPADTFWTQEDPYYFPNVIDEEDRKLAKASVWRYYRITRGDDLIADITPDASLKDAYIEFLNEQVETTDDADGNKVPRPPLCYGTWYENKSGRITNAPAEDAFFGLYAKIPWSFSFDVDNGLVIFSQPTYKYTADLSILKANLWLRTSCLLRFPNDRRYSRRLEHRQISQNETKERVLRHEELYRTYIDAELQDDAELKRQAGYYLTAAEREYEQEYPQSVTYVGMQQLDLDGAIQQVTYQCGPRGFTTAASRNTEDLDRTPSYKEKRQMEYQAASRITQAEADKIVKDLQRTFRSSA